MTDFKKPLLIAAGLTMSVSAPAMAAHMGFSLGTNGTVLVTMPDADDPTTITGMTISDGVRLNALAYRPNTDQLYGYSGNNDTVYTVDITNARVAPVASTGDGIGVAEIGFDFNNQVDAARLVSTDEDNLVYFPNNDPQDVMRFTDLFYAEGDVNEGVDPSIFANGYTNQVPNAATTQQYALDADLDILTTLANNDGTLATIGQLSADGVNALDFTTTGGFDIFTNPDGVNIGYALLNDGDGGNLYTFDDFTVGENGFVAVTDRGRVASAFGALDGLAVFLPRGDDGDNGGPAPIPLPAGIFLLGGALGGLGLFRRKRKG